EVHVLAEYVDACSGEPRAEVAAEGVRVGDLRLKVRIPQIRQAGLGKVAVRGFHVDLLVFQLRAETMVIGPRQPDRLDGVIEMLVSVDTGALVDLARDRVTLIALAVGHCSGQGAEAPL